MNRRVDTIIPIMHRYGIHKQQYVFFAHLVYCLRVRTSWNDIHIHGPVLFSLSEVRARIINHTHCHYNDVIMNMMVSQITSLTIVYSTVYSGTDQRKHQSSASLVFVRGIHRGPGTIHAITSPVVLPNADGFRIWKSDFFLYVSVGAIPNPCLGFNAGVCQ